MSLIVVISTVILTIISTVIAYKVPKVYDNYWQSMSPNWNKFTKINDYLKITLGDTIKFNLSSSRFKYGVTIYDNDKNWNGVDYGWLTQAEFKINTSGYLRLTLAYADNKDITGQELESRLEKIGIVTNKNAVPFDTKNKKETSGLRIGAAAVTSRGLGYEEMITIAKIIYLCINDYEDNIDSMKYWVKEICKKYPLYQD